MNTGLISAITLGLLRCGALAAGVWLVARTDQKVIGGGLIAFATGMSVGDKFKVDAQVKTALATPAPLSGT